jgi:ankyrin repeat protein
MREIFGLSGTECGFTGLHLASLFGLEHIVEGSSHTGSNFDIWDYLGRTPLTWAAGSGNETVVSLLLDRGTDPNSATKESFTPLFYAAAYGHAAVVRLLIDGGANVNFRNKSNETPLFFAAKGGDGVRLGPRSLFSMGDHALVIKLLLDAGANIDHENLRHETPLHAAANNGHEVAVRLLLERNANINSNHSNYCGPELIPAAPLTAAARKGYVKITKLLLESGADTPFLRMNTKMPPYSYALSCLSKSAIDEDDSSFTAILQESGDPSFRDEFERLPLHWAASRGDGTLVQRILKAGCNPNPKDIFGRTPLFAAICRDRVKVVKVLLDHPDIDAQSEDKLGFTPLQESCKRQRSSNKVPSFARRNSAGPWDEVTNLLKVKTGLREECPLNANVPFFPRDCLPQQPFYSHCDVCLDILTLGSSQACVSCNMITKKDGNSGATIIYCGICISGVKDCPLCGQSLK